MLRLPQMRLALRDARRHLMVGFEYVPRMVEQLTIAWMIDGLNRHDLFHEGRSVLPDVLDQLGLFIRRTGDQHRSRIGNRFGNTLEKCMILRRTPAPDAVGLVVEMAARSVRVNDKLIRLVGAEMKYPRLPMIDPDNRVIVSHLTLAAWPHPTERERRRSVGERLRGSLSIPLPAEAGQLAVARRRRPDMRRLRYFAASYSGKTEFPLQKWPGTRFPDAADKSIGRVVLSPRARRP